MAESNKGLYFLKDKKAGIYHPISIKNSRGSYVLTYLQPIAPAEMWCYARQLTQDQIYAAAAYSQKETRLFVFNFYSGVKVGDALQYRGEWYEVTRADTADDYNGELFVYVKTWTGAKPTEEMKLPYGADVPSA